MVKNVSPGWDSVRWFWWWKKQLPTLLAPCQPPVSPIQLKTKPLERCDTPSAGPQSPPLAITMALSWVMILKSSIIATVFIIIGIIFFKASAESNFSDETQLIVTLTVHFSWNLTHYSYCIDNNLFFLSFTSHVLFIKMCRVFNDWPSSSINRYQIEQFAPFLCWQSSTHLSLVEGPIKPWHAISSHLNCNWSKFGFNVALFL